MTGIGIDLQVTACRVAVAETTNKGVVFHPVSDGIRQSIPLLTGPAGVWGSAAALAETEHNAERRAMFWQALARRLQDHFGGLRPGLRDGIRTTVAFEDSGIPGDTAELGKLLTVAGFEGFGIISPADAILAACLWRGDERLDARSVLVGIAVGEAAINIRAVRLAGRRRVDAVGKPVTVPGVGHAIWRDHLRGMITRRLDEPPSAQRILAIADSISDFAMSLARAPPNKEIEWRGPSSDLMFSPVVVKRSDMRGWPQVSQLEQSIPDHVHAVAADLGAASPALIAIGGVGAVWPFVRDAVSTQLPVWNESNPVDAVAHGASIWMELNPFDARAPAMLRAPAVLAAESAASASTAPVPPWRKKPDPFGSQGGNHDA